MQKTTGASQTTDQQKPTAQREKQSTEMRHKPVNHKRKHLLQGQYGENKARL